MTMEVKFEQSNVFDQLQFKFDSRICWNLNWKTNFELKYEFDICSGILNILYLICNLSRLSCNEGYWYTHEIKLFRWVELFRSKFMRSTRKLRLRSTHFDFVIYVNMDWYAVGRYVLTMSFMSTWKKCGTKS
jgi:hypothetical protein